MNLSHLLLVLACVFSSPTWGYEDDSPKPSQAANEASGAASAGDGQDNSASGGGGGGGGAGDAPSSGGPGGAAGSGSGGRGIAGSSPTDQCGRYTNMTDQADCVWNGGAINGWQAQTDAAVNAQSAPAATASPGPAAQ